MTSEMAGRFRKGREVGKGLTNCRTMMKKLSYLTGMLAAASLTTAGEPLKPLERIQVKPGESGAEFVLKDSGKAF